MADKPQPLDARPLSDATPPAVAPGTAPGATPPAPGAPGAPAPGPVPPRRSPGHRGADVRDTVAEMAAKAQEISQEAGSKMAAAMKDVISAAAGLSGFAIESARDLVQYMVRRGQMTQEEADKLIREAEAADAKRKPHPVPPPSRVPKPPPPEKVEASPVVATAPSLANTAIFRAPLRPPAAAPVREEPPRVAPPAVAKAAPAKKAAAKPKKKPATAAKSKPPAKAALKKKTAKR